MIRGEEAVRFYLSIEVRLGRLFRRLLLWLVWLILWYRFHSRFIKIFLITLKRKKITDYRSTKLLSIIEVHVIHSKVLVFKMLLYFLCEP